MYIDITTFPPMGGARARRTTPSVTVDVDSSRFRQSVEQHKLMTPSLTVLGPNILPHQDSVVHPHGPEEIVASAAYQSCCQW